MLSIFFSVVVVVSFVALWCAGCYGLNKLVNALARRVERQAEEERRKMEEATALLPPNEDEARLRKWLFKKGISRREFEAKTRNESGEGLG